MEHMMIPLNLEETPSMQEFKGNADGMLEHAKQVTISDAESAQALVDWVSGVKALGKQIDDFLAPWVKRAHQMHEDLVAMKKDTLAPLEEAEALAKSKLSDFHRAEQERVARELKEAEEAARLAQAEEAETSGDSDLADAYLDGTVPVPVDPVADTKLKGASFSDTFSYEVEDEDAIPRGFMIPDDKAIKAFIKATKGLAPIDGIRIIKGTSVKVMS